MGTARDLRRLSPSVARIAPTLTKWGAKTSTGREGWVESRHSPLSSRSFSVDRRAGTTNDDRARLLRLRFVPLAQGSRQTAAAPATQPA